MRTAHQCFAAPGAGGDEAIRNATVFTRRARRQCRPFGMVERTRVRKAHRSPPRDSGSPHEGILPNSAAKLLCVIVRRLGGPPLRDRPKRLH